MNPEDIGKHQRIRHVIPPCLSATVTSRTGSGFSVHYDDDPAGVQYGYGLGDASGFEPIPEKISSHDPFSPDLMEHPAVQNHGKGVSSADLASFTECMASMASSRIQDLGHKSYGMGDRQKFEGQTSAELIEGLLEEVADAINYLSMAAIKALVAFKATQYPQSCPCPNLAGDCDGHS
jgi:hypothetical protein